MVKKITTLMTILALGLIASSASAAPIYYSGLKGATITITPTALVPGATPLIFNPSAEVNISGGTVTTSFSVMAGHEAVKGKDAGQNYAMAADSNAVFWQKAPATYVAITANTNSAPFQAATWNRY